MYEYIYITVSADTCLAQASGAWDTGWNLHLLAVAFPATPVALAWPSFLAAFDAAAGTFSSGRGFCQFVFKVGFCHPGRHPGRVRGAVC